MAKKRKKKRGVEVYLPTEMVFVGGSLMGRRDRCRGVVLLSGSEAR